jgi:hypothetical protein
MDTYKFNNIFASSWVNMKEYKMCKDIVAKASKDLVK